MSPKKGREGLLHPATLYRRKKRDEEMRLRLLYPSPLRMKALQALQVNKPTLPSFQIVSETCEQQSTGSFEPSSNLLQPSTMRARSIIPEDDAFSEQPRTGDPLLTRQESGFSLKEDAEEEPESERQCYTESEEYICHKGFAGNCRLQKCNVCDFSPNDGSREQLRERPGDDRHCEEHMGDIFESDFRDLNNDDGAADGDSDLRDGNDYVDDGDGDDGDGDDGDGDDGDGDDGDGDDGDEDDGDGDDDDGDDGDGDDGDGDRGDGDDGDGDDVDDDGDDVDGYEDRHVYEDELNAQGNFSLVQDNLRVRCRSINACTVKEALALSLAVFTRHSLTYEALVTSMMTFNVQLGRDYLPTSKKGLWRALNRNSLGLRKHAYCRRCLQSLGTFEELPQAVICACGHRCNKKFVPSFVEMSLVRQLKTFLAKAGVGALMYSKVGRQRKVPGALEDIYDGQSYRRLAEGNNILATHDNFSYQFNTDGFRIGRSSAIQVWPIYVRLNDLPLNVRQKYMFLAGVWIGRGDPHMNLFFQNFVREANFLSQTGIQWSPDGVRQVVSKFVPVCCPVDSKARCAVLNMAPPTAYYGCTSCTHSGVYATGVKFPVVPHPGVQEPPQRRTDASIKQGMVAAHRLGVPQQGIAGPSVLMNMEHLDLGKAFVTDDLHPLFEGVTNFHMSLLLESVGEPYYIGNEQVTGVINRRLTSITQPSILSRNTRSLEFRKQWRGHEWRNWILYYCVPCLQGAAVDLPLRYLRHLEMLSRAIFLVSRDSIIEEELLEAEDLFRRYVAEFEDVFGVSNMRFNVHVLLHVVDFVREWGPLFLHSTFSFESWNMILRRNVKSPKDPLNQIVTRFLIKSFLGNIQVDQDISERVKLAVKEILEGVPLKNVVRVQNVYLIGEGEVRAPTVEELVLLQNQHVANCGQLTVYKRALYGRLELRTESYGFEAKINNNNIYTWDDAFCSIKAIIKVTVNGEDSCMLFVKEYNVSDSFATLRNTVKIENEIDRLTVCTFENVRGFAVKVSSDDQNYVTPVTNNCEID